MLTTYSRRMASASTTVTLSGRNFIGSGSQFTSRSPRPPTSINEEHISAPPTSGTAARTQGQTPKTTAPQRSILRSLALFGPCVGLANQRSNPEKSPQYLSLGRRLQEVTIFCPRAGSVDHLFPPIHCHFRKASELFPPICNSDISSGSTDH